MSKKKPTSAKQEAAANEAKPGFDVANFAAGVTHAPQEPPTTDTTAAPVVEDTQPSAEAEQPAAPAAEGEPADAAIDAAVEVMANEGGPVVRVDLPGGEATLDETIDAAVSVMPNGSEMVTRLERGEVMQLLPIATTSGDTLLAVELLLAPPDPAFYSPRQINVKLTGRQQMVFGMLWRSMIARDAKCEVYQGMPGDLVGRYSCRAIRCLLDTIADDYEAETGVPLLSPPKDDGKEESSAEEGDLRRDDEQDSAEEKGE